MTEAEIIKALEVCVGIHNDCESCPLLEHSQATDECMTEVMNNALDLINRQKAEIERLTKDINTSNSVIKNTFMLKAGKNNDPFAEIKAEAIEEFAESLKEKYSQADILCPRRIICLTEKDLENLVKEKE